MIRNNLKQSNLPVIGITVGDINGVGPEVILKSLSDSRILRFFTPVIYGSVKVLNYYGNRLGLNLSFNSVRTVDHVKEKKVNVIECWTNDVVVTPGEDNKVGGDCALRSLRKASDDLVKKKIAAIVTAPINKNNIQGENFKFPGHTEFFTSLDKENHESLMLLCSEGLRVGVVTGHIPLSEVEKNLTKELLRHKIRILLDSLKKDFSIQKPKIAILGLNPHAGENGLLGTQEEDVILPVIKDFKRKAELVFGAFPSDGFFGKGEYQKFDGVLGMYHDQGLIPFKTLSFGQGVNFTSGLDLVRTSPDHGTAYDIAGKGVANEGSMREALYLALDIVRNRDVNEAGDERAAIKKKYNGMDLYQK